MKIFQVGLLVVTMFSVPALAVEPHGQQTGRPVAETKEAGACTEEEKAILRSLPFSAQTTNVHALINQAIEAKKLSGLGAQGSVALCYEMGQGMTALKLLKLIKEEDAKKVDGICHQSKLFGALSAENLMTLKEISEKSNDALNRRYFPDSAK